tara:strand:+ start:176 stop:793 length:618 start_codon:yes stop_codon:yes gene_type:complete
MNPSTMRHKAFQSWLAESDANEHRQDPIDDLIGEHHLMTTVLAAMESETQGLLAGRPLRNEFWAGVVDFNGNFVHLCHRVKEEIHLIPLLLDNGLLQPKERDAIHREHESARDMTLDLCRGVEQGDWERVMRIVSIYIHLLRPHMSHEEAGLFVTATSQLPAAAKTELRAAFAAVDQAALAERGRQHYAAIASELAKLCGQTVDW